MVVEPLFYGGTLRGHLIAAATRDDMTATARLVDAVKQACYVAAELGPIQGGRLGSFRQPADGTAIVPEVAPQEVDLQDVGSQLGEALYRLNELGLGDIVTEASKALTTQKS